MDETTIIQDTGDFADVLAQQLSLKIYTQISFCFPIVDDDSSHSAIIETLTNGLERLSASFPWLAGQVVHESSEGKSFNIFKIKPYEKTPPFFVKDLQHDPSIPSMDTLRKADFPFSMLNESIFAPRKTIPGDPDEQTLGSDPVFLVQASFITGGLVLTFVGQHNAMDMTGQGQVINLFSKACCNEPFTSDELTSGNLPRYNLIPLLEDSYEPGSEMDHFILKSPPFYSELESVDKSHPPPPKCIWSYFCFDHNSLTALKTLATKTLPSSFASEYISTDDSLTAFVWQAIIRCRISRLNPTATSTLCRAVDVRQYCNISPTYPGLMLNMKSQRCVIEELMKEPLGGLASKLRSALDPKTLAYESSALATLIHRSPNKNLISFCSNLDPNTDIALSSWAKLNSYELDFNLGLGKPEAVRRPQFIPIEGLIYFMPKDLEGGITVAICLREEDMKKLRTDEEFSKYAKYIG